MLALCLCLCMFLAGCDSDSESGSVLSIRLRYNNSVITNNTLAVDLSARTVEFTAVVEVTGSASTDFSLQSSDSGIAAVSGKTVALVSGGKASITAIAAANSAIKHTITLDIRDDNVYTIEVTYGSADKITALSGETVTLTQGLQAGRTFSDWTIEPPGVVMLSHNQFTMPSSSVTVTGNFMDPAAGTAPYNITNNFAQDSSSGFVAQWHNDAAVTTQTLQVVAASGSFDTARNIPITGIPFETSGTIGTHALRNIFRAEVSGLSPATLYKYRIGEPGSWSKTFTHMTSAGRIDEFSFTVITDPQNNVHTAMITAMELAESYDGNNRFFLDCGDITERVESPVEIISYTNSSNVINMRKPVIATQGNHDTYKSNTGSEINLGESTVFNAFLTFPDNGFRENDPYKSKSYYFYYNEVLFIMLNTLITTEQTAAQVDWLKGVLEHDKVNRLSKYRIVATHFGVLGNHYYENYWIKLTRDTYGKIYSDYAVDIVFSGHDHTYSCSNPIVIGTDTAIESINFSTTMGGTVHCIAGTTGPKFYNSIDGWATGAAPYLEASFRKSTRTVLEIDPGMYINVKVGYDRLSVTAIRVDGWIIDQFEVEKK